MADQRLGSVDPVVIRDELFNILLAGRDSVGSLLAFTIYLLSLHPGSYIPFHDGVVLIVSCRGRGKGTRRDSRGVR